MKMTRLILIVLLVSLFLPEYGLAQDNTKSEITVYYFHNIRRCATCNAIENNTRKTLEEYFETEMESGKVKLIILNAEEKQNEQIVEKYEIWGSSLLIVKRYGGSEKVENMTEFAFSNARTNTEKFIVGLKDNITKMIE